MNSEAQTLLVDGARELLRYSEEGEIDMVRHTHYRVAVSAAAERPSATFKHQASSINRAQREMRSGTADKGETLSRMSRSEAPAEAPRPLCMMMKTSLPFHEHTAEVVDREKGREVRWATYGAGVRAH